ncbi:MAG TPA: hypothetical protein VMD05_07410 [Candidatus Nanoarchaeia archaeon]|nr:hypothetical protein [Candidatus Nanoarchaeia archaeon]
MLNKKPQIVRRSSVEAARFPICGNIHASRQVRKDYDPQVEAVFCNRCGKGTTSYEVWNRKPEDGYTKVALVKAHAPDQVYVAMQHENRTPRGEALPLI